MSDEFDASTVNRVVKEFLLCELFCEQYSTYMIKDSAVALYLVVCKFCSKPESLINQISFIAPQVLPAELIMQYPNAK